MEQEAMLLASAAVVGVACAKLGSAIGDDAAVMVGGRNLRGDLMDMKTKLEDIGARLEGSTDEEWVRVVPWLKRVKEAAYDICDMLDDLQADNNTTNTIRTGMLTRLAIVPNATNKIRDNLRVILQESPSFSSAIWSSWPLYRRRETPPPPHGIVVEGTIITGRDEEKECIIKKVLSAADEIREGNGPIILPIVGMEGVGKTTLAKLVSDDARFKDYTKVSHNFDSLEMGRCIISQLSGGESKDSNGMDPFITKLLVSGKKLLVVLDDLRWDDISELGRLRRMLSPLSDRGSKVVVIVTTRYPAVAWRICTLPAYRLNPLSDDMCWTIIKQRSAFEARADKQELEQIGREIAHKCMSFPLAAQALGYMLRSKDPRAWSMLLNNAIWNDRRIYHEPVYASLVLCFQDMPPNMRLCFAYCAIIPHGHGIARDELIHQWIALGFIQPSDRSSTTHTVQLAEEYITTLLGLRFLQPTKSASVSYLKQTSGKDDKGAMLLTMHELVRSLARLLFRDELFVVDHIYEISDVDNNYRYALINDFGIARRLNLSRILLSDDGAFSSAKRLRVLDLRDCPMKKLPDSICQLTQLRYLNLSGRSGLVNLPELFEGLKNLVYLYLSGHSGLVNLPESFGKLENLVHLDLSGCSGLVKLPELFARQRLALCIDHRYWHRDIEFIRYIECPTKGGPFSGL